MRDWLLDLIRCPKDSGRLGLAGGQTAPDGHVLSGTLTCAVCGAAYPIRSGVPYLQREAGAEPGPLGAVQSATASQFGIEWEVYKRWGWHETLPEPGANPLKYHGGLLEHTRSAFWGKSLLQEGELGPGSLVLDAGCGNGRFCNLASGTGARVVGVDLSPAVHSAFENTRANPDIAIVRGDLFAPPLSPDAFDLVFSIGVLMHTGDARRALTAISRLVKPGGLLTTHIYGLGLASYEAIDSALRAVITRLPLGGQFLASRLLAGLARVLRGPTPQGAPRYWRVFRHIQILPTEHHMFDWWTAPVASHHTVTELTGWFVQAGFTPLRTSPPLGDEAAARHQREYHSSVTCLGRREQP